jgi:hypothetical protein
MITVSGCEQYLYQVARSFQQIPVAAATDLAQALSFYERKQQISLTIAPNE